MELRNFFAELKRRNISENRANDLALRTKQRPQDRLGIAQTSQFKVRGQFSFGAKRFLSAIRRRIALKRAVGRSFTTALLSLVVATGYGRSRWA
jgi:hypothetical protein